VTEISFYHLQTRPLDAVLPVLLEKSLARGWRALVHCGAPERLDQLDSALWTFRDDSFLPHGRAGEPDEAAQPILLTLTGHNANNAVLCCLVDNSPFPDDMNVFTRILVLFDGNEEEALAFARGKWREARDQGHAVTYWQQDDRGTWIKKA
jgi:DNA polymerase III subunit chi